MSAPLALQLDADNFCRAFPFHIVVDQRMRIVQTGQALARLLPRMLPGAQLEHHLTLRSHFGHCDFQRLQRDSQQLVVLYDEARQIKLRGQFCPQGEYGFFLVSLWLDTPDELARLQLSINDFALHDPVVDLLNLVQAHRTALEDSQALSRSLERQRQVLAEANAGLRQREAELQRLSQELNAIFSLSPDGLLTLDAQGKPGYANSAFFRLAGLEDPAQTGRPLDAATLDQWLTTHGMTPSSCADLSALPDGCSDVIELGLERPRILLRSIRQVRGGQGARGGCIVYLRDMTRERELDAMKTEFLTTAAHELRTPLSSIFGYVELLRTRTFSPERQHDLLNIIWRQSRQLMTLLNELLDLVRIESGAGKQLQMASHSLADLVQSVVCEYLPPELGRPWTLAEGPAAQVRVDAAQFRAALSNLLSNAIKYSAEASPVHLQWQFRMLGQQQQVGISVQDQGCGMTPEQLQRAGERFYRADPNGTIAGTGLGLALVREIMRGLGGELCLASVWQQGTQATLWLPLEGEAPVAQPAPA